MKQWREFVPAILGIMPAEVDTRSARIGAYISARAWPSIRDARMHLPLLVSGGGKAEEIERYEFLKLALWHATRIARRRS